MTADEPDVVATPVEPEAPEVTWVPVSRWPSEMIALRNDILDADQVIEWLDGAADDFACQSAVDFVREMRAAGKSELAMRLLELHGVALPDKAGFQTPQEKISEQLRKNADLVRERRPDITPKDVGMREPPSSRARREPPRYGGMGPLGSLGRERG
jgi:hypothetical protein